MPGGLLLKGFVFMVMAFCLTVFIIIAAVFRWRLLDDVIYFSFVLSSKESFQLAASKFQDSPFVTSSGACIQQRIYPWTELRFMLSEVSPFLSFFPIFHM